MKLIKHIIFVDLDSESKIMINSLIGTMDEINTPIYETLIRWKTQENIEPLNESEKSLFDSLQKRGYLINNEEEETNKKNEILEALRRCSSIEREQCRYMTFIMTYDCNFRCPYCFEGDANIKKAVITPEQIDTALDLCGSNGCPDAVLLFGGEPLLPKTKPSIEYLISKIPNKQFDIITNGYYLEEFIDLLKKIKIGYIMVTLDGDESNHNSNRYLANGNPTYQKIISGIKKCLENNIPIKIRMNISEGNVDVSQNVRKSLLDFFNNNKLLTFEISPMLNYSDKLKNDMFVEMFCSSVEYSYNDRIKMNHSLGTTSPIVSALTAGMPMRPLYSFCYAHENKLAVDPYGNLYTCLLTVGRDNMEAGKYYPNLEYRENSIKNRNIDKIPECKECIYSLLCGGGCPMRLSDYSNVFKPACESIKSQIHDLLPKLYKVEREHKQKIVNNS